MAGGRVGVCAVGWAMAMIAIAPSGACPSLPWLEEPQLKSWPFSSSTQETPVSEATCEGGGERGWRGRGERREECR